jgi:hypothetical protein
MIHKKKTLHFILFLTAYTFNVTAQTNIGLDAGLTFNKLDLKTINDIKLGTRHGYLISVNVTHKFNKELAIEISSSVLQKNYSIENKRNIYQNINNTYAQLPLSVKYNRKIANRLTLAGSFGIYYAYWLKSKIDGIAPNIFNISTDSDNNEIIELESFRYTYHFDSKKHNRSEFGLASKIELNCKIINNLSCGLKGHYYHSLTSQQKVVLEQQPSYNETFALSLALACHFN